MGLTDTDLAFHLNTAELTFPQEPTELYLKCIIYWDRKCVLNTGKRKKLLNSICPQWTNKTAHQQQEELQNSRRLTETVTPPNDGLVNDEEIKKRIQRFLEIEENGNITTTTTTTTTPLNDTTPGTWKNQKG